MYSDKSITLDPDCFGERFVTKINEFAAMWKSDWAKHFILEMAIVYQLYYMASDKCKVDLTFNDFLYFCWNDGCTFAETGGNIENNWLYMTRSIIDAAIVWYEGVPASAKENPE